MNDERNTRVKNALIELIDALFDENAKTTKSEETETEAPRKTRAPRKPKDEKPTKPAKDEVDDVEADDEDDEDVVNGEDDSSSDEPLTLEDAREVLHAVIKKLGPDSGREVLKKFKLKKVSDLSEDKIGAFVAACEELVD